MDSRQRTRVGGDLAAGLHRPGRLSASADFLGRFPHRVINLHPALPGAFPGTHAIERAYQAWQRGEMDRSGVMVHLVADEGVDCGPVLGVEEIPFQEGESPEAFEARVHAVEHRLLVATLRRLMTRPFSVSSLPLVTGPEQEEAAKG